MSNEFKNTETHEFRCVDVLEERMSRLGQNVMLVEGGLGCHESIRDVVAAVDMHDDFRAVLSRLAYELALATDANCGRDPSPRVLRSIEIQIDRCTDRLYEAWSTLEVFHEYPRDFMTLMPNVTMRLEDMRNEAVGRLALLNSDMEAEE